MFSKLFRNKLLRYALLILFVGGTGTFGYMHLEHWHFFDALYMTVTTLTTVGYGETHQLHYQGRLFTIFLILFGVGTLLYILSDTAHVLLNTDHRELFGRRIMNDKIEKLEGHQIVCGYGRTGQEVARQLTVAGVPFVIIEADKNRCMKAQDDGLLWINGDATEDSTLKNARVSKASGIVCALSDDAANTFIALGAKEFNEKIKIVCRAANPGSESKMTRAGADNVVSPYVIAGRRMASAVTHPLVLEFLDVAMHNPQFDLRLEQIKITLHSKLAGKSLKDANIKQSVGAMVLAVNKNGQLLTNPGPALVFEDGDILVALGAEDELKKLSELAGAKKT